MPIALASKLEMPASPNFYLRLDSFPQIEKSSRSHLDLQMWDYYLMQHIYLLAICILAACVRYSTIILELPTAHKH